MPGSESEQGELLASQIETTEVWRVLWESLGDGRYDVAWLKDHVTEDSNFASDLSIDSLDLLEFFLRLEDHFNVSIPQDEYAKLTSVKAISLFLKSKLVQSS
jgi:acyl carrier protein